MPVGEHRGVGVRGQVLLEPRDLWGPRTAAAGLGAPSEDHDVPRPKVVAVPTALGTTGRLPEVGEVRTRAVGLVVVVARGGPGARLVPAPRRVVAVGEVAAGAPLGYALSPSVNTIPAMPSRSDAVAVSSVESHDAMSPAPTSTGSAAAATDDVMPEPTTRAATRMGMSRVRRMWRAKGTSPPVATATSRWSIGCSRSCSEPSIRWGRRSWLAPTVVRPRAPAVRGGRSPTGSRRRNCPAPRIARPARRSPRRSRRSLGARPPATSMPVR